MKELRDKFDLALSGDEADIQKLLEENTELFHFPFYIGEHIEWNAIISKFPIDTNLITDFVYITRNSGEIQIVLVELEKPGKQIFTDTKFHPVRAELTAARAQIDAWKHFIEENGDEVKRRILKLLSPAWVRIAKVRFKYVLIYGRNSELANREGLYKKFAEFSNDELHLMTYDSLWTRFERKNNLRQPSVLKYVDDRFTFKKIGESFDGLFAFLNQDSFFLSSKHEKELKTMGYDIDSWKQGKPLNGKTVLDLDKLTGRTPNQAR